MLNLYIQYFTHKNEQRKKEIDYCLKKNIQNKNLDKIYIVLENEFDKKDWMNSDKTIFINYNKRSTFKNLIEISNTYTTDDDINIITNSDIFFDDSLSLLKSNDLNNKFVALTRWNVDVQNGKSFLFNVNCSQDTWVWKGVIDLTKVDLDYYLGIPGCDNAICGEFHEIGYKVINPSLVLKSHHLHAEISRSYTDNDVVRKRLYLLYPSNDWNKSLIEYWKDCTNFNPS